MRYRARCSECPHELVTGVACDWKPEECRYNYTCDDEVQHVTYKHLAWANNMAEEKEYDAVKSLG